MKKLIATNLLLVFLATPLFSFAATSAGLTPKSPFYFLDTLFERINLALTFNPEKKARKALEYADERLAEAEASTEDKNSKGVETALTGYKESLSLASEQSKEVKDSSIAENLFNQIASTTSNNEKVLVAVFDKVPDEVKTNIVQAIKANKSSQNEANKQITKLKNEIEQLKKEINELKSQQSIHSEPNVRPSQSTQPQNNTNLIQKSSDLESNKNTSINEEIEASNSKNFFKSKDLIFLYQNQIKNLENDINSMYDLSGSASFKESFDYLKERRQLLLQRSKEANDLRTNPEKYSNASKNYYYAQIINETIDEYLNDLNQEIINIDSISRYGNSQIPVFKYHINEYQKKIASLSNDPEKIVPKDEFIKELEITNKSLMLKWDIAENLNAALKKYLNNVPNWEDVYAFRRKIITNNIIWIAETQIAESQNYSRQLEQEQQLMQQQKEEVDKIVSEIKNMVPKTTNCTLSGDGGVGLQAYINCISY